MPEATIQTRSINAGRKILNQRLSFLPVAGDSWLADVAVMVLPDSYAQF